MLNLIKSICDTQYEEIIKRFKNYNKEHTFYYGIIENEKTFSVPKDKMYIIPETLFYILDAVRSDNIIENGDEAISDLGFLHLQIRNNDNKPIAIIIFAEDKYF